MADRPYDLALLGATGFAGRLTAHHLAGQLDGSGARWAIAGRDPAALHTLRGELAGAPTVEVVDVADAAALERVVGRTRVLASTVGPFARHGEPVVRACVRAGTHYADITGEPAFVDRIRAAYDTAARERGVRVVPCCGFEAVPADLGVQLAVAHLPDDAPIDVRGYVHVVGGGISGGTAHTALDALAARHPPRVDRGEAATGRTVALAPRRPHRLRERRGWGVPLPTIDPVIVLRSARTLPGYGTAVRYGHYARVRRLPTALGAVVAAGALVGAASLAPTRGMLRRRLPAPGDGPSPERRAHSRFTVTVLATAGGERVTVDVRGGEPAYDGTALMLGTAACSLAFDDARPGGVLTPAAGLGADYRRRLHAAGLTFAAASTG